jgi:hypothetical protein
LPLKSFDGAREANTFKVKSIELARTIEPLQDRSAANFCQLGVDFGDAPLGADSLAFSE